MKKHLIVCLMMLAGVTTASAQSDDFERGIFNHVGLNAGIGTEGIAVGIAAPITDYLELGFGVNIVPSIKVKADANIDFNVPNEYAAYGIPTGDKVKITGDFARTTMDVKLSVYPFGGNSTFFVAGGFSFGGKKMATVNGHSDVIAQYPEYAHYASVELDKYNINFDKNGDVNGDIRVKNFRPYVGLGVGRLVPIHRVGCRFELGCQFAGKLKVYQNDAEVKINELNDNDDDLSKVIDKLTVYPVLKFTITGRIF